MRLVCLDDVTVLPGDFIASNDRNIYVFNDMVDMDNINIRAKNGDLNMMSVTDFDIYYKVET